MTVAACTLGLSLAFLVASCAQSLKYQGVFVFLAVCEGGVPALMLTVLHQMGAAGYSPFSQFACDTIINAGPLCLVGCVLALFSLQRCLEGRRQRTIGVV